MVALLEQSTYHSVEQSAILPTIAVPCLLYMSEADDPGFVETRAWVSKIPDVTFATIGGTHFSGDPEVARLHDSAALTSGSPLAQRHHTRGRR